MAVVFDAGDQELLIFHCFSQHVAVSLGSGRSHRASRRTEIQPFRHRASFQMIPWLWMSLTGFEADQIWKKVCSGSRKTCSRSQHCGETGGQHSHRCWVGQNIFGSVGGPAHPLMVHEFFITDKQTEIIKGIYKFPGGACISSLHHFSSFLLRVLRDMFGCGRASGMNSVQRMREHSWGAFPIQVLTSA